MDKETLSNYGWIVVCVLVLAVMLALSSPFGTFVASGVKSTTQGLFDTNQKALNTTGLMNIENQDFGDIPSGGVYAKADGTILKGDNGDKFPDSPATGDIYEYGDYEYRYNSYWLYLGYGYDWINKETQNGWGVKVKDTTKSAYSEIISEIAGEPVNTLSYTFYYCTALTKAPIIPNSVTNMYATFQGCTSLKTYVGSIDADGNFSNYQIPSSVIDMCATFLKCTNLKTAPVIPNSVENMRSTFWDCTSLTTTPTIPNSVTNMDSTFWGCTALTTAPAIPDSVTNMLSTFQGCTALKTYVGSNDTDGDFSNYQIPNSVTNMVSTFEGCTNLTTAPVIPNSVTNMWGTFYGCTSLTTAPAIPNSVTNMSYTFRDCTSLITAPVIPNSVTNMNNTFYGCTSLEVAPAIPSRVTNIQDTFRNCTSLTGTIEINASNLAFYLYCFDGTEQSIKLTGACPILGVLASTASKGNVSVK